MKETYSKKTCADKWILFTGLFYRSLLQFSGLFLHEHVQRELFTRLVEAANEIHHFYIF